MFSFVGDTVLDPFAGLGTTSAAAMMSGRNSFAVEIEPSYFEAMAGRIARSRWPEGEISVTRGPPAAHPRARTRDPPRAFDTSGHWAPRQPCPGPADPIRQGPA